MYRIVGAIAALLIMGGILTPTITASAAVHHQVATCSNEYIGSIDPPTASGEVHWLCNGNPFTQNLQGRVRCLHNGSPYFNYGVVVTVVDDQSEAACNSGDTPKGLQVRFSNQDGSWGPWNVLLTF